MRNKIMKLMVIAVVVVMCFAFMAVSAQAATYDVLKYEVVTYYKDWWMWWWSPYDSYMVRTTIVCPNQIRSEHSIIYTTYYSSGGLDFKEVGHMWSYYDVVTGQFMG